MDSSLLKKVGNTPSVCIREDYINLFAKLEFYNPMGSIKDRAANYVLEKILNSNEISNDTMIVESSSGNFGVALAAYCKFYGLPFTCVVDPLISPANEMLIRNLKAIVEKVDCSDENGNYLSSRLDRVKQIICRNKNVYWINQYENPYVAEAYENTIGVEICKEFNELNYVFIGVSSGGTITGVSHKLKKHFPEIKVVAVDIEGSVIFGNKAKQRYLPGIGSNRVPPILNQAQIDYVECVSEIQAIQMCRELLEKHCMFVGASSGAVYAAIKSFFMRENIECNIPTTVLAIFPDGGNRYVDTVYNDKWCSEKFGKL